MSWSSPFNKIEIDLNLTADFVVLVYSFIQIQLKWNPNKSNDYKKKKLSVIRHTLSAIRYNSTGEFLQVL